MTTCDFLHCEEPAPYVIVNNAGRKPACEWHAVEHFREMHASAYTSLSDLAHRSASELKHRTERQIDMDHALWRNKFLQAVASKKTITPPAARRPEI